MLSFYGGDAVVALSVGAEAAHDILGAPRDPGVFVAHTPELTPQAAALLRHILQRQGPEADLRV